MRRHRTVAGALTAAILGGTLGLGGGDGAAHLVPIATAIIGAALGGALTAALVLLYDSRSRG